MQKNSIILRQIVISSLFLAIAVVLNLLTSFYIPLFGVNGAKISFAGVFTFFPAMLFGPLYGAAVGGLTDLIGYILKPAGAYIPLITLTAILGGFLNGLLWNAFRKIDTKRLRIIAISFFSLLFVFGVIMHISLYYDGIIQSFYASSNNMFSKEAALSLLKSNDLLPTSKLMILFSQFSTPEKFPAEFALHSNMMTIGFEIVALLGILVSSFDIIFKRERKNIPTIGAFSFIVVMLISGLITTTLNTGVLMLYFESLAQRAFMLLWIPRAVKAIFESAFQAYLASILYTIYSNSILKKHTLTNN